MDSAQEAPEELWNTGLYTQVLINKNKCNLGLKYNEESRRFWNDRFIIILQVIHHERLKVSPGRILERSMKLKKK